MTFRSLALVLAIAGCEKTPPAPAAPETERPNQVLLSEQARAHANLGVEVAGPREARPQLVFQGDVRMMPAQQASVVARVPGVVREVRKRLGDRVRRGDILALIASRELADAKMAYFESEHALEFAEGALTREQSLLAKGVSTREAYLEKKHAAEEAEVAHAAALQRLTLLGFDEASLHELQEDLDRNMSIYRVRAPAAGEIVDEAITLGASVAADEQLGLIADLSHVSVEIEVPIRSIRAISPGIEVVVACTLAELEGRGSVVHIGAIANRETRTVPVRVEIDNPEGRWRPGMAARVDIEAAPISLAVALPPAAVHQVEGRDVVFVAAGDGRFEVRPVTLGYRDNRVAEVTSGVTAGEQVAVTNSYLLKAEWLGQGG